jgi:signal transduction histidine kinase
VSNKRGSGSTQQTIRTRLTGVVVVPSVILLVMWAVFSSYTVYDGIFLKAVASAVQNASIPSVNAFVALQQERELSMTQLSRPTQDIGPLHAQQQRTDQAVSAMHAAFDAIASTTPPAIADKITQLNGLLSSLPQRRAQVDAGKVGKGDIFAYYNSVVDAGTAIFGAQARAVPDPAAGEGGITATELFRATDLMLRASSLASGALVAGQFSPEDHQQFAQLVGAYHSTLDANQPFMLGTAQDQYNRLVSSSDWKNLVDRENALIEAAPNTQTPSGAGGHGAASRPALPVTAEDWAVVSGTVGAELTKVTTAQAGAASDLGIANGNAKFTQVLVGSLIALVIVLVGILTAVRISRRLVNRALITRLTALKTDARNLAEQRLPDIVDRLQRGERVDVAAEVPALHYGSDEIGQMADAFNAAQFTAVAAAVKQGQAREGVNRVFLGIAHRNQGLVHRQLKILDRLEREEENSDQLDALFQLDHLATRARRNAENLIILAGEQPGRQWRKPVRLLDVLRAAVAETEQYARVKVHPAPDLALVGASVADTIHLIAELVDNATSFSSPRSQVEVHSSKVPSGVVIEIEDHGLGITPENREVHNAMLANPPEFDAMSLTDESRLGLFVVARLSLRRGIKVELRESPHGGTLAMVLLPNDIVADLPATSAAPPAPPAPPQPTPPLEAEEAKMPVFSSGVDGFWAEASDPRPDRPMAGQLPTVSSAPDPDDNARPSLPRRQRQQNLAPQLRDEVTSWDAAPDPDSEPSAERVRDTMSAFQRGTREARDLDLEP